MKKIILPLFAVLAMSACKKTNDATETPTLDVAEKNMPFIAKYTSTGCGPCGSSGWVKMENTIAEYGNKAVYAAFYSGGIKNDLLSFFSHKTSTPNWIINFIESGSYTTLISGERNSIDDHIAAPVIANANYEMSVSGTQVNLKTTTEFFADAEGEYVLMPFMIVGGIVANQAGNPDGANTVHEHWVKRVAKPIGYNAKTTGYKIASGKIKKGYKVNLDFETTRDLAWAENDISFGLVIMKEQGDTSVFVNAFTKSH